MKKFFALAMVAGILVAACSSGSGGGSGSGQLIGIAMPTKSSARWIADGDNLVKSLTAMGYKTDLQYAEDDIPTQVSQIENMITNGAKVLVIAAIDGTTLADTLQKAADAGTRNVGGLMHRIAPGRRRRVLLVRHEARHERLTRRAGESAGRADEHDHDVGGPHLRLPAVEHEHQRARRHDEIIDDENPAPVEVIRDGAGHEREWNRRQKLRQADEAERQRVAGDVIYEPCDRHRLDLQSEAPQETPGEKQPEIAVAENGAPACGGAHR